MFSDQLPLVFEGGCQKSGKAVQMKYVYVTGAPLRISTRRPDWGGDVKRAIKTFSGLPESGSTVFATIACGDQI